MLLISIITISALLLVFFLGRNKNHESSEPAGQEEAIQTKDTPSIDYTKLDSVINQVPENYEIYFGEAASNNLSGLLNDVDHQKNSMTQEMVDKYAKEIEEIINSSYYFTEVPQVYIQTENGNLINQEYSSASIAIVDFKDIKSDKIIDTSAEIKIRGNSTAEAMKKPYTIKFSKKEDVLGMGKAKKWFLNANALDKTLMRNKLVFDFASAIGLKYSPETTFVDVWLNGRYIGNYLLSETIQVSPSRVDINTDQGDFLIEREFERYSADTTYFNTPVFGIRFGVNEPKDITEEQLTVLTSLIGKIETAIKDRDWKTFSDYVDVKSYIDYYILSELFKVVDFDYSSTRFYIKNGKLYAGPPWDNDLSSGNADTYFYYDYNYHEGFGADSSYIGLWCNKNLYTDCYEFPEFNNALRDRYQELQEVIQNLYEDNSLGTNRIDDLIEKYGKSFDRNYTTARWTISREIMIEKSPEISYEKNVEYLREWLKKRNEYLLDSFE
jgi:spore coat protein CotH